MALLPSGSLEDVELVKIETDDLSLVIKGKPYHHRYEGLQQYRKMDHHDIMEFSVHGATEEDVLVYHIAEQRLTKRTNVRPIFFENGAYQIIVFPKKEIELTFYHEHPGLRRAVSRVTIANTYALMGSLHFQNEVGLTTFEIRSEEKKLLDVTLEVFPTKLDYKSDYKYLLDEVNNEIYNLAFHFIRKTYLGARIKLDGKPSKSEFYRLITKHFEHFLQALSRIERQPHHLLRKTYEKARGDQLRKLDTRSRNYLQKRGHLFVGVTNGITLHDKKLMPIEGLKIKKELTFDTLENRYVKWMMERISHKLEDLLETILNRNARWETETDLALIERIKGMKVQLERKLKNHFWRDIQKLDRSVMSLVFQMAPGYRDAFQIYLTVSKGLMLQGKLYQMSVKDVATLYEYWTFLKLGQILDKKYKLTSQDIVKVNRDGLFVNLQANQSATRKFLHPITNEKIELTYQKYEGNLPTIPQKPDTMLSISKKGRDYSFNYVFDAKYRVDYALQGTYYHTNYQTPGPMEEDINTMHRYRDSIVASHNGPYERTAFGAYVLFPWFDEDMYQHHPFYKSINKVNIGGLPFLPNTTSLVEQFVERLIEMSPEELQQEGILPRGAEESWQSSLDEKVLVGLVSTSEDYQEFEREGYYKIDVDQLKKGWQDAMYVALYAKNGVAKANGVTMYGKIKDIKIVQSGQVVRFNVQFWTSLNPFIRPVNYGIAGSIITTYHSLKQSKELPELFMKSKEEMILWRMLRRISDEIKLGLNHNLLDQATLVEEFAIKGITIKVNKDKKDMVFSNFNRTESVPIEILTKNTSSVFKLLTDLLG
ncbi:DUF2357 domain-containing protein [Cytobacillus sp. FJAT-54145]|uniref:DUF2357 domain-containing protein n=1 Tax=Cytobacillus spartinae TaxID=3299023 RepID=A0ABW6K8B0_9BACI